MENQFKQALFTFEIEEVSYDVFFTPCSGDITHIKIVKENQDVIFSKLGKTKNVSPENAWFILKQQLKTKTF